jgi:hypothetical protein
MTFYFRIKAISRIAPERIILHRMSLYSAAQSRLKSSLGRD